MSFRDALTALSALSVTGIARNYDIDALPENPGRASLPLLMVLPIERDTDSLFQEQGGGFQAVAFSGGGRTVTCRVTHLLLIAPVGQSRGMASHLPDLVTAMDAYFSALATDVDLGGLLLEPARVRVEPGIFPVNGTEFYGCAFRHTWLLAVS